MPLKAHRIGITNQRKGRVLSFAPPLLPHLGQIDSHPTAAPSMAVSAFCPPVSVSLNTLAACAPV
ncbi:hypothetical protein K678_00260 [Magnetospirillum fulvum MGU-K5]|uniref:Uncharacterized protein n=1 Tax=Magnetospirillum fulvum MGU-K5 TaxID=1316936 RepID=S9SC74_MAGFU|nr:hypothetical protein K678_00260 [Magnetospirillum fulvum MGU-K5]